ncbi:MULTISPECIES: fasciclin domain-containing protein [unclassified Leeuwenhoekiella]|uniref:fasciclin domain-containing protein n=1 Tax=unclassified Leeuwenhoekiella TaxID=2615029 RepID=UPI000C5E9724|nr:MULTISPECIES: fasciclin domain-containing protein [unclassified Leeuwenhoekiella]MAW96705.1 hypothetical protein [Leeuwenhoekiella sp.]MBA81594.1 hypothetical protein [Leeuwenhoekiella sp.]|tara:strand:+ start:55099 stop:56943 length:1845 start_codon:yes stop_codon:yes gene_type:complete
MKHFKQTLRILLFVLITTGLSSCSDDDDNGNIIEPQPQTIAEFVAQNPNYSSLAAALERTSLTATLDAAGTFTVFAPDNDAFDSYLGGTPLADVPVEDLTNLLLNHVLGNVKTSSDLTTGYEATLATYADTDANINMFVNTDGGTVVVNGTSTVESPDNVFTNGVVHTVSAVIDIPSVATFATADPTFDSLESALTADASFTYASTLSDMGGTFTVFAPTNAAFAALLEDLDASGLGDLDPETIAAALNLHVISGSNVRAADLQTGTETTLGGTIEINADDATITDANGRVINIIVTDVQAGNGVVHAIDAVIMPELPEVYQSIAGFVSSTEDYSLLLAALEYAELDATLAGEGTFTVFAPNNAAFTTFLGGAALTDFTKEEVAQILLNHVLGEIKMAADLGTGYEKTLATYADTDANIDMFLNFEETTPTINGASTITDTDLTFNNGVIHPVSAVIELPSIATFATADPQFSTLLAAVAQEQLAGTLSGAGTFTVFAPTNAAFTALIDADPNDGISSAADILALGDGATSETSTLDNILRHHVLDMIVRAEDLSTTEATTAPPLFGPDLSIDATATPPTITDGSGATYDIIATNITATNGVVHAIDGVLMPGN